MIFRENIAKDDKKVEEALKEVETIVVLDSFYNETAKVAHFYIPLAGWFEMEGTTINFKGHLQKISKCLTPPKGRKPFYDVVSLSLKILKEMEIKDFESKNQSDLEKLKIVLQGFEKRDVCSGGFLPWFKEVKNVLNGLKDKEIKDLLPYGIFLKGKEDGNS